MPQIARRFSNFGPEVLAKEIPVANKDSEYYCKTPNCPAKMTLVNAGNVDEAHFRRMRSSPEHISVYCTRNSIIFDDTKYSEDNFNKNDAFEWIYGQPISRPNQEIGTMKGHMGGNTDQGIRTLKQIYEMCITRKKTDYYNGFLINDIIADAENYNLYKTALNGNMIVECSFYKGILSENALLFNYPAEYRKPHILLKAIFQDKNKFLKYNHLYENCNHTELIIIAGNWESINENSYVKFQCEIVSSRQIYYCHD